MTQEKAAQEAMTTLEGNKLIADFMGAGEILDSKTEVGFPSPFPESQRIWKISELKYHSSWDWLMPCVEKIRLLATGDNRFNKLLSYKIEMTSHAKSFTCLISKTWWESQGNYKEEKISGRCDTTSLENVVFLAVVEFIQWHNQQK